MARCRTSGLVIFLKPTFKRICRLFKVNFCESMIFIIIENVANFDDKKDSVKTIVVAVSTQFNSFEEKCDILVTDSVEVLAFNLNINNT